MCSNFLTSSICLEIRINEQFGCELTPLASTYQGKKISYVDINEFLLAITK